MLASRAAAGNVPAATGTTASSQPPLLAAQRLASSAWPSGAGLGDGFDVCSACCLVPAPLLVVAYLVRSRGRQARRRRRRVFSCPGVSGRRLRAVCRSALGTEAAWTATSRPDFEDFSCRLLGRWQASQGRWQAGVAGAAAPISAIADDEVSAEVSEIYRRCGSLTGVEDAGRRDMASPGFVFFECGSWMDGPCQGVLRGGSFTAAITSALDRSRRCILSVTVSGDRFTGADVSLLCRQTLGSDKEAACVPPKGLRHVDGWRCSGVRAMNGSAGGDWSSRRLRWQKCVAADADLDGFQEVTLPFGCIAARRQLACGSVDIAVGVFEPDALRMMVWRHGAGAQGTPTSLSLFTWSPPASADA